MVGGVAHPNGNREWPVLFVMVYPLLPWPGVMRLALERVARRPSRDSPCTIGTRRERLGAVDPLGHLSPDDRRKIVCRTTQKTA